jgi:hypothetical protein
METPFDAHELSKNELAAESIRCFGELRLRVTGSSMLPAVRPDDVLFIRHACIDQVSPGDLVLYSRQRRLFAHRVISRSSDQLITQGDSLTEPDLPVSGEELLGRVVRIVRSGKAIDDGSEPGVAARMAAALFRRSARASRLYTRLLGLRGRAVQ